MGLLQSLFKAYEEAEENRLVDRQEYEETVLLPVYHSNLSSNGTDVIELTLDCDSELKKARFLDKKESIIFPVSEDSVSRTGKNPPPHPLVDKLKYLVKEGGQANEDYKQGLDAWIEFSSEEEKRFLNIIKKALSKNNLLEFITKELYPDDKKIRQGFEIKEINQKKGNDYKTVDDLSNKFITFKVRDFIGDTDVSVTNYQKLHSNYIDYIDSFSFEKTKCNITGKEGKVSSKHRGIMGTSKVISVSNHVETYIGRFRSGEDVIRVTYKESEKIHLMLKYLLENENSRVMIGGKQYVINWFSDDLANEDKFDITAGQEIDLFDLEDKVVLPVTSDNSKIGKSFIKGRMLFDKDSDFYISIIDKACPGRISIKYFNCLKTSELVKNLERWQDKYSWYRKIKEENKYKTYLFTPSLDEILLAAYGIERDRKLVIDNDNFVKDQKEKMVIAIIERRDIPANIIKALMININSRLKYKDTWEELTKVARAVLNGYKNRRYTNMLEKGNTNRSYLYGRLLAVFDSIEACTQDQTNRIITNADRFWTAYVNNPARTMLILMEKLNIYERKLKSSDSKKYGLYIKFEKEKKEIINLLEKVAYTEGKANDKLEYDYIFGFYAEKEFLYTKTNKEEKEEEK